MNEIIEEKNLEKKFACYSKLCDELNIKRDNFTLFVFESVWFDTLDDSKLKESYMLTLSDVSEVYDNIKKEFSTIMFSDNEIKHYKKSYELSSGLELAAGLKKPEILVSFDEDDDEYDLENNDDYDLAVGPNDSKRPGR